ncbi:TerD family protein [Streptomyces sp. 7-21]|uniref:TerD family protein n=1 Tax=Streptomyces sp. 7-21 TaxID=2802283 RepID=UPI00191D1FEE|nr:TerD family protein [Streptomyces sp. 7-21]MBL1069078.1 tellurium resistance TerZ family protein [Streptomyces sp. 7-21]
MSVSLSRGQSLTLDARTPGGGQPTVRMGLGWKAAPHSGGLVSRLLRGPRGIDLDASAVLFSGQHAADVVYFRKLTSDDGSVTHTGDSHTGGAGREDNESITVRLAQVPERIDQIFFTVTSFTGQAFTRLGEAFCRLVEESTGRELARYTLSGGGDDAKVTAQIMAKVRREDAGWRMTALGVPATGRTLQDLLPALTPLL